MYGYFLLSFATEREPVPRNRCGTFAWFTSGRTAGARARSDLLFQLPEEQRVPHAAAARPVVPVATAADRMARPSLAAAAATEDPNQNLPIAVAIIGAGVLLLAVVAMTLVRRIRTAEPSRG